MEEETQGMEDLDHTQLTGTDVRKPVKKRQKVDEDASQFEELDGETTQSSEDDEDMPPSVSQQKPRPVAVLRRHIRSGGKTKKKNNDVVPPNATSCSGIVKSLKMYNFMCHDGFYQEWHNNLNFVTGENGSGKSALLSGLLIGLGAKAAVTSRTKSLTSLIQKGKECARTEITLLNSGALPLGKYGTEIKIERTISKAGQSAYKLATFGKWRKMKKNELDYILLCFNIQLDNPVAILNQEVAKNFLRTKDPRDKYQLFYQGTLLSKLFGLLASSKKDIEISQKNLDYHKASFVQLRNDVKALKSRLDEMDNLRNTKATFEKLGLEFLWTLFFDEEKRHVELLQKIQSHDASIQKMQTAMDTSKERKKRLKEEIEPGQQKTMEIRDEIRNNEQLLDKIRYDSTNCSKKLSEAKASIKSNESLAKRQERNLAAVTETLKKLADTSEEEKQRRIREYEERKVLLSEEKIAAFNELKNLKQDLEQFGHGLEVARAEMHRVSDEQQVFLRLFEGKKRGLEGLKKSGQNKFAIFGRNMEALMSSISTNARKFKKQPRGPIAAFVTVKDERYKAIVEFVLSSCKFLVTFLVDNNEDYLLLKELIKNAYVGYNKFMPSIKINSFGEKPYNTGSMISRLPGAKNLLDIIEVENNDPVILNGLVDYVQAERTLMFDSNSSAANVLKDESKFNPSTKNGFTLEFYKFNPAPRYSCTALDNSKRNSFLRGNKRGEIEQINNELRELQNKLDELKPALDNKRREENVIRVRHEQMRAAMEDKRKTLNQIERSLISNEREKYQEPDVASHDEEIAELEEALQAIATENAQNEQNIIEMNAKLKELNAKKEQTNKTIESLQNSIEIGAIDREDKLKEINKIETLLKKLNEKSTNLQQTKEPTLEAFKKCERELGRKLSQAENRGEKLETNRTSSDVKKEIEETKIRIELLEQHIGDERKLRGEHEKKKTELEKKMKEYRPLYKSFHTLKGLVQSQLTFLFTKRLSITNGLTLMFQNLVEQRGYKGQLMIDHNTEELHFFVCPDKSASTRTKEALDCNNEKQTKKTLVEYSLGLSGGERSFATICFIISLWQVMECPFYMLDEFDVFMDAFNRKASQQALIAHAKLFKMNQFFLFSPLDLVEVPGESEATVIRLKPATRASENSFSNDLETENVDPEMSPVAGGSKSVRGKKTKTSAAMSETNRPAKIRRV